MKIYYRISDVGYSKVKPHYIDNEKCLNNFCRVFSKHRPYVFLIADNCSEETLKMAEKYVNPNNTYRVHIVHGAGTFNLTLDMALENNDEDEIIYFIENDYLHRGNSPEIIKEGIELGADFVSLYDHPDKYIDGVNPYVYGGGEETKVFLSKSCHWKLTNSTTMTFASTVKSLGRFEKTLRQHTSTSHPHDFEMWIDLRKQGASLITPIPGYATHGESAWLSPLINWNNVNSNT